MSFSPFNPFTTPPQRGPQRNAAGVKQPPKTEKEIARDKRKQALRFMFNPELGQSFDSMKYSHSLFMSLIANVFLQTGLIDATYPGLREPSQLKLTTLLQTAYHGLEFTREGMPRVLLFGSFVASLAAVVFAIFIFALSVISAPAEKAPKSVQDLPPEIQQKLKQ